MVDERKTGGTVIEFPRQPDPAGEKAAGKHIGENHFYPRRFHPLRDPAPFFLPILITVIGAILVIGAGWVVLHVQRAQIDSQESAAPDP